MTVLRVLLTYLVVTGKVSCIGNSRRKNVEHPVGSIIDHSRHLQLLQTCRPHRAHGIHKVVT